MAICFSSSVAVASECATDPNECTLNKLCVMATSSDSDGNTIWSISLDKLKHVTVAQSLDIECGVRPIVDPCDLDPNECKLNQICDKATTEISGKKSWDENAEAYVNFAKKFGLKCDVDGETIVEAVNTKDKLCNKATIIKNGVISWNMEFPNFVIAAKNRGKTCNVKSKSYNNIKNAFTSKPKLYRQKLQYALKELQFYSYATDGLWGEGTRSGFDKFIKAKDLQSKTEDQVFKFLLSKVDVPSSFTAKKTCSGSNPKDCDDEILCNYASINNYKEPFEKVWKTLAFASDAIAEAKRRGLTCGVGIYQNNNTSKKTTSSQKDNAGLTAIITNPSISGRQALAICRPQAKLAKSRSSATANSSRNNRTRTYDLDCSFGSCTARDMTPSGGKWGGILQGLTEVMAGKNAYSAVMDSCLAQYGWRD